MRPIFAWSVSGFATACAIVAAYLYHGRLPTDLQAQWLSSLASILIAATLAFATGAALLALSLGIERSRVRRVLLDDLEETIDAIEHWGKPGDGQGITIDMDGTKIDVRISPPIPVGIAEAARTNQFDRRTHYLLLKLIGKIDVHRTRINLFLSTLMQRPGDPPITDLFLQNLKEFFLDPLKQERVDLLDYMQEIHERLTGKRHAPGEEAN